MADLTAEARAAATEALILRVRLAEPAAIAAVASAIRAAGGDCQRAAEALGVARQTIYRWRKAHPALEAAATLGRIAARTA